MPVLQGPLHLVPEGSEPAMNHLFIFPEAVQTLAAQVGVELPQEEMTAAQKAVQNKKEQLFEIQREAAKYFYLLMRDQRGSSAYKYFEACQRPQEGSKDNKDSFEKYFSADWCI